MSNTLSRWPRGVGQPEAARQAPPPAAGIPVAFSRYTAQRELALALDEPQWWQDTFLSSRRQIWAEFCGCWVGMDYWSGLVGIIGSAAVVCQCACTPAPTVYKRRKWQLLSWLALMLCALALGFRQVYSASTADTKEELTIHSSRSHRRQVFRESGVGIGLTLILCFFRLECCRSAVKALGANLPQRPVEALEGWLVTEEDAPWLEECGMEVVDAVLEDERDQQRRDQSANRVISGDIDASRLIAHRGVAAQLEEEAEEARARTARALAAIPVARISSDAGESATPAEVALTISEPAQP